MSNLCYEPLKLVFQVICLQYDVLTGLRTIHSVILGHFSTELLISNLSTRKIVRALTDANWITVLKLTIRPGLYCHRYCNKILVVKNVGKPDHECVIVHVIEAVMLV